MGKWAKYARNYKKEWEKEPDFKDWLSPSNSGDMAYCRACKVELRPHVQDLKLHSTRVRHANNMKRSAGPAAGPLASFVDRRPREPCSSSSDDLKVAELRLAAHLAVHGSFLTADHLTPVISGCFSDSVSASAVTLGRTKCAALVTKLIDRERDKNIFYSYKPKESSSLGGTLSSGPHRLTPHHVPAGSVDAASCGSERVIEVSRRNVGLKEWGGSLVSVDIAVGFAPQ
ncbi:hypothetical protein HPB51_014405 [Rhipicephalus microplus]|uniref:Uncharacterized protein n=1 Tax=Rhipicephalus microplus TaxID=6941 RepID=A0A9J6F3V6_RHIMP|nr:hypothetical protein HPB51_014405 [Rhipicephalus microplus]